jgi:hypothetical protein
MDNHRATARQLAQVAMDAGRPLEWFEQLYAKARSDGSSIPWADHAPNPKMAERENRFPNSKVTYLTRDLFQSPDEWLGAFDVVLESYTLQVLPPELQAKTLKLISEFVSPDGYLILIARLREESESTGAIPWPLLRREIDIPLQQPHAVIGQRLP